jgi:predicted Zn-ribbon and HTH transcriptional regulator
MMEDITCRVCGWTGERDDLNQPPTGHEKYYCPECATIVEIE